MNNSKKMLKRYIDAVVRRQIRRMLFFDASIAGILKTLNYVRGYLHEIEYEGSVTNSQSRVLHSAQQHLSSAIEKAKANDIEGAKNSVIQSFLTLKQTGIEQDANSLRSVGRNTLPKLREKLQKVIEAFKSI